MEMEENRMRKLCGSLMKEERGTCHEGPLSVPWQMVKIPDSFTPVALLWANIFSSRNIESSPMHAASLTKDLPTPTGVPKGTTPSKL